MDVVGSVSGKGGINISWKEIVVEKGVLKAVASLVNHKLWLENLKKLHTPCHELH